MLIVAFLEIILIMSIAVYQERNLNDFSTKMNSQNSTAKITIQKP